MLKADTKTPKGAWPLSLKQNPTRKPGEGTACEKTSQERRETESADGRSFREKLAASTTSKDPQAPSKCPAGHTPGPWATRSPEGYQGPTQETAWGPGLERHQGASSGQRGQGGPHRAYTARQVGKSKWERAPHTTEPRASREEAGPTWVPDAPLANASTVCISSVRLVPVPSRPGLRPAQNKCSVSGPRCWQHAGRQAKAEPRGRREARGRCTMCGTPRGQAVHKAPSS